MVSSIIYDLCPIFVKYKWSEVLWRGKWWVATFWEKYSDSDLEFATYFYQNLRFWNAWILGWVKLHRTLFGGPTQFTHKHWYLQRWDGCCLKEERKIKKSKNCKTAGLLGILAFFMPCVRCLVLVNQHLYVVSKQNRLTKRRETGSAVNTTIHTDDLATTTSHYSENASVKKRFSEVVSRDV